MDFEAISSPIDVVYGRAAHIYNLQSRHDKKNVVVAENRKDFNAGENQGNFKKKKEWEFPREKWSRLEQQGSV